MPSRRCFKPQAAALSLDTFYPSWFQDSGLSWATTSEKKIFFLEFWKHKHSLQKLSYPLQFSWHPLTLTSLMCLVLISSQGYRGPEESFGSMKTTNHLQGNSTRNIILLPTEVLKRQYYQNNQDFSTTIWKEQFRFRIYKKLRIPRKSTIHMT